MTLRLNGSTSGYTEIDAPAVAGSNTLVLPGGNGSANQRLITNGSGTLSWSSDAMLASGSASAPSLYVSGSTGSGMWSPAADTLAWSTAGTERMRITNSGDIYFGSTADVSASVFGATLINGGLGGKQYRSSVNTTIAYNHIAFFNTNGIVGTVSTSGSATAYNTSSDYRLKENVTAVTDGITRLQQLKPSRFNFIADPDTTVDGFIAHQVQEVVPEAISGEKDAVDDDGNPIYQGIDQSKLVPLLTAALQEAVAKIESLETRIAALEVTP